jgi:WD40 repeat protein
VVAPGVVALSPDGKVALVGYKAEALRPHDARWVRPFRLYDTTTGQCLRRLRGHDGNALLAAFLPDGKRALTVGGTKVILWDVRTGKKLWWATPDSGGIREATVSPDGNFLLTLSFRMVERGMSVRSLKLYDLRTGKLKANLVEPKPSFVRRLSLGPKGKLIFIGSGRTTKSPDTLLVLDARTGKAVRSEEGEGAWWKCPLAYSPDGKLALSESAPTDKDHCRLVLWEVDSGKLVRTFASRGARKSRADFADAWSAAFTPDGKRVLSWDGDGKLRTWDVATGRVLSAVSKGDTRGWQCAFARGGKRAVAFGGHHYGIKLAVWDTEAGEELRSFSAWREVD